MELGRMWNGRMWMKGVVGCGGQGLEYCCGVEWKSMECKCRMRQD